VRVLIAGAAGFIGSHLTDTILEEGHEVVGIDNFVTGRPVNIKHLMDHPRLSIVEQNIVEPWEPDDSFDQIYHLASPASPIGYMRNSILTHLTNSIGTYNLLQIASRMNAKFLYASTSEAYGDPEVHPQPETYFGNVNPVGPRSCYDESKRFGESITMEFVRNFALDGRIIRIFNTYGPRSDPDDGRVIPAFIMGALRDEQLTIYGNGQQTRSLCYVGDLVKGIVGAMNEDGTSGEVINLGNPDERTVQAIAETIIETCNSSSTIRYLEARPDDPYLRCPDISKARRLLNWSPTTGLEAGLRSTIDDLSSYVTSTRSSG
jgi:UDP-glucuronate decarboxylase